MAPRDDLLAGDEKGRFLNPSSAHKSNHPGAAY
jgi:hypothetical protein